MCGPRGLPGALDALYHNNGDGTFTDVTVAAGVLEKEPRYGLGVAVGDYDNDGWPDIYVANDSTPSYLFRNRRDGTFEEVGLLAGVAVSEDGMEQAGMGTDFGDYDNDGWLDITKSNFSFQNTNLYHNERDGRFVRAGRRRRHRRGHDAARELGHEVPRLRQRRVEGHRRGQRRTSTRTCASSPVGGETYDQRAAPASATSGNGTFADVSSSPARASCRSGRAAGSPSATSTTTATSTSSS